MAAINWIELLLKYWKTIFTILTLLVGTNVFQEYRIASYAGEATSYKQGYEALAVNVQTSLSTKPAKLENIKPCNCQQLINLHVKQAH